MPAVKANHWVATLNALLSMTPRFVLPAHFRWAMSCMAATSERGAKGLLRRAELGCLLKCANASAQLGPEAVKAGIVAAAESKEELEMPPWLRSFPTDDDGRQILFNTRLNTRQVAGLLLQLASSSPLIAKMFKQYAGNGPMSSGAWCAFVQAEQLGVAVDQRLADDASAEDAAMDLLQDRVSEVEIALGINQFASRLLCPQNNAVLGSMEASDALQEPLAHSWYVCSHAGVPLHIDMHHDCALSQVRLIT